MIITFFYNVIFPFVANAQDFIATKWCLDDTAGESAPAARPASRQDLTRLLALARSRLRCGPGVPRVHVRQRKQRRLLTVTRRDV
jgi:hypothetical protein